MTDTVKCVMGKRDFETEVEVVGTVGGYAIHPRVVGREAVGPEFTVTHIGSGISIWTVADFDAAIRVARFLDEKSGIPQNATFEQMREYRDGLSPVERTSIYLQLQAIAPRTHHPRHTLADL